MIEINAITNDPRQIMSIVIQGYDNATFSLEFKPNQYSWYFSLSWQTFSVNNMRVTTSPNMLRQWKNILPFGLACLSNPLVDPSTLEAFTTYSKIYLLSSSEILDVEADFYGQ